MREWTVSREESGQRLDKFLRRRLPLAPPSFIYKMLRKKNITLCGKKADGSEKVEEGDRIKLFLSEETIQGFSSDACREDRDRVREEEIRAYRSLDPVMGKDAVLYEDPDILVLRKPAGVLSQKAGQKDISANEWLRGYLALKGEGTGLYRPSVCNRLDRNTGGILLCAKTLRGSRALTDLIRGRMIRKTYRMVVRGRVRSAGRIEDSLVKDRRENLVRVAGEKDPETALRHAVTVYRPVKTGKYATLVEADLITGRSHQLRVHMASIGHPIIGDTKYGKDVCGQNKAGERGQLLWCTEVEFPASGDGSDLPEVLLPLAGRAFSSPAPKWWDKYYRD